MEQTNNNLSVNKEEKVSDIAVKEMTKEISPLLLKVRQNFGVFGGISLIFGIMFTLLFYKTGIGLNLFVFGCVMVGLLCLIMTKLSVPIKKGTKAYYLATLLLGLSSMLTSSWVLTFFNLVGILLLLDLSLIHQLNEDAGWDLAKYFGKMVSLPILVLATIGMPFKDMFLYLKSTKLFKNNRFINIITGVAISIPLLWIIIGLLSSADLLFGKLTNKIYHYIFSSNIFPIIIMIIFGFLACYCIICGSVLKSELKELKREDKKASASIAITVLFLLGIVYILFCSLQVLYLFNNGFFVLPSDFTYAEYARRGFFELLTVTVINIILMLICTLFFEENKFIRILLTIMTACTYIMIGSAVYRMVLYISAYNLTFLRLFVLLFLFIDALVLIGVIVSVYHKSFPLFGYMVSVITVCYLAFSFAKPDYFIAKYQVMDGKVEYSDMAYLTESLSLDAAKVLVPYFKENYPDIEIVTKVQDIGFNEFNDSATSSELVKDYYDKIVVEENERGVRDYNFSFKRAFHILKSVEK